MMIFIVLLVGRSSRRFTLIKSDVLILFVFRQKNLEEDEEEHDEMRNSLNLWRIESLW